MASFALNAPARVRLAKPIVVVALVAGGVLAAGRGVGLLDLQNPFATTVTDSSGPALMKALTDLREFHGSTAQYQQVVEIERDQRFVPDFVSGSSTTFLATGSVDGIVDFSGLDASAVQVSPDGKSVAITLPPAVLGPARLDASASHVLDRDRGLVDRAASAVGEGSSDEAYWAAGQARIAAAAAADPAVLERAEANARTTLTALATSLGYDSVTVTFAPDPVTLLP